eukprot:12705148-Alexandrium_andersonii.AAC.1
MDVKGPCSPPGRGGWLYILSYQCQLCGGLLLKPLAGLAHHEIRQGFMRVVLRSGSFPTKLSSDNGPEMKNAAMAELTALLGIRQRFGAAWRPCEQGG